MSMRDDHLEKLAREREQENRKRVREFKDDISAHSNSQVGKGCCIPMVFFLVGTVVVVSALI